MESSKKPLHSYEQSMLLSAMLFDRNNIAELLKFFPEEQAARMNIAKDYFFSLPRNERMTQIVLEMRRLLLIDEHRINWIHPSWIESALKEEPNYLQNIIRTSIEARSNSGVKLSAASIIPSSLIFRMFIEQLTKTPQKTALYDPALMRLQSLKGESQDDSFFLLDL